jgi:hypothetical protein
LSFPDLLNAVLLEYIVAVDKKITVSERETDTFVQKPVSIGLNGSEEMGRELLLSRLRINDWLVPLISFAVAILLDHHSTCRALQFKQLQCSVARQDH